MQVKMVSLSLDGIPMASNSRLARSASLIISLLAIDSFSVLFSRAFFSVRFWFLRWAFVNFAASCMGKTSLAMITILVKIVETAVSPGCASEMFKLVAVKLTEHLPCALHLMIAPLWSKLERKSVIHR